MYFYKYIFINLYKRMHAHRHSLTVKKEMMEKDGGVLWLIIFNI